MPAGWLTSREACDRLGVRPQSLYAYVSRGLLTARKQGRRSLYDAAAVEALAQRTARGRRPGRLEIHIDTEITLLDPTGKRSSRKPSAMTGSSSGSARRSSITRSKPSPRNQWNVSSITAGERSTHRSFMFIFTNSCVKGLSAGSSRRM